jgi:hypothetical protein
MADKAILFGINQYKRISNLRGCANDVRNVQLLLTDLFGFAAENVRARIDDKVTKKEIEKQWKWLLNGASAGDRLIFHFSGHGSYTGDQDGDEDDGVDELLCLYDMDWSDSGTYLLDDDLRKLTETIPEAIHVTFLLDSCHSGTGTRVLELNAADEEMDIAKRPVIDVQTSVARLAATRQMRTVTLSDDVAATEIARTINPQSPADAQRTVLARFVPPPRAVGRRLRRAGVRRPLISMRDGGMNHVLFSGSRSDQTSVDAYIDGDFHGAFTYYFCEAIRTAGNRVDHQHLIERIRERLLAERFTQVPQLEPDKTRGPIFEKSGPPLAPVGIDGSTPTGETADKEELFLSLLRRVVDLLEARASVAPASRPVTTERQLVYVHGICRHEPGYSKNWWAALKPHLSASLAKELESNRHEVLWSEIVSPSRAFAGVGQLGQPVEEKILADSIRAILEDRAERQVVEQVAEQPRKAHPVMTRISVDRAALGIPGLNCVDDFAKYLLNESIRDEVLDAFLSVVEPLLRRGDALDIMSHSWGTVVAYEGLRRLDGSGLSGEVQTLFTVGSALSIGPVRSGLLLQDGARPECVRQWINLDAKGDIVGGALEPHGFAVDAEYLGLHPSGCRSFAGIVTPSCAHGSYFHAENRPVNGGVFARHMG